MYLVDLVTSLIIVLLNIMNVSSRVSLSIKAAYPSLNARASSHISHRSCCTRRSERFYGDIGLVAASAGVLAGGSGAGEMDGGAEAGTIATNMGTNTGTGM